MSKTLQELTAHFPAKWDEITIRATKDQFLIKKCDEILHDGQWTGERTPERLSSHSD